MFQGVWTTGLTWSTRTSSASQRHKTDYDFLEEIGSGGFGRVFRVQHKLDGKEYALKVVRTSSSSKEMEKIVREVQVLSSIQNDHVVRYYSAWIEPGDISELQRETSNRTEDVGSSKFLSSINSEETLTMRKHSDPVCNLCQSTYTDWEVALEQWGLIDAVLQPLDLCVDCYKKSIPADVDISHISIRDSKFLPDCLYILMEYCESTLSDAISDIRRDGVGDAVIWGLFGQVLEGFAHLHADGIIHRDVKPSNLFVHNNNAKIGDLGLATTFSKSSSDTSSGSHMTDDYAEDKGVSKSSDVGTYLYMAPEVSDGRYYNEKSDIYSLGVVLVEIFHPFSTAMERAKVLGDLHRSVFPKEWTATYPVAYDIAQRMLKSEYPSNRPSCFELLQELQARGLYQGNSVKDGVSDLQSQVTALQALVEAKNQEIGRLRQLLEANNVPCD